MSKLNLYYTVEKEVRDFDGIEECTGNRTITVYTINDNKPHEFTTIECTNEDNSEEMIQDFLIEDGHGDEEFNLNI